jgi:hypothetical protein
MQQGQSNGVRGTWERHIAQLTLQNLKSQPDFVFHHMQTFPQHVVQRGLEATILAQDADVHEMIASYLPTLQPPPPIFYAAVRNDVCLLQEKITKTYVVSKIADKIHSSVQAGGRLPCQYDLNGGRHPMRAWMDEVQSELEPLGRVVAPGYGTMQAGDNVIHRSSFCDTPYRDGSCTRMLLEFLNMLGYQATVSKGGRTLYLK